MVLFVRRGFARLVFQLWSFGVGFVGWGLCLSILWVVRLSGFLCGGYNGFATVLGWVGLDLLRSLLLF